MASAQYVPVNSPASHIWIGESKITTVQQWRGGNRNWKLNVRKAAKTSPVFVLRADGSGTLFYSDEGRVRTKSWKTVSIVRPRC